MASLGLRAFCAREMAERRLATIYQQRVQPIKPRDNPTFKPSDVSIVLATVCPNLDFVRCLDSWIANEPKEIIIVTVPRDVPIIKNFFSRTLRDKHEVTILTVDKADHRAQQICSIKAATGPIIAMVDDDTFVGLDVLKWRIAPLEDPTVAGVTGVHHVDIPQNRRDPSVPCCWEAFSVRGLHNFNTTAKTRYGADGGVWCLIGCSQVLRADVVKDPKLLRAFESQTWRGKPIKTGLIITAWYLCGHAKSYRTFARSLPWLSRHIWALFLYDTFGWFFLELYVWFTMAEETWVHKNGIMDDEKVVIEEISGTKSDSQLSSEHESVG